MSKLTVHVSLLNSNGVTTSIEGAEGDSLTVFENRTGGQSDDAAREACHKAAKVLRAAALKFESLAKLEDILQSAAQDKFNGQ